MTTDTCTGDLYTCNCAHCAYDAALQSYDETLAEIGSGAFMLYGNAADAITVAHAEVQPPRPEDFGLSAADVAPARQAPRPIAIDPDDLPF